MPESGPATAPPPLSHAHHAPPPHIRGVHKKYQKASVASLQQDEFVLKFGADGVSEYHRSRLKPTGRIPRARTGKVFKKFEDGVELLGGEEAEGENPQEDDILIYEHTSVPGTIYSASAVYSEKTVNLPKLYY